MSRHRSRITGGCGRVTLAIMAITTDYPIASSDLRYAPTRILVHRQQFSGSDVPSTCDSTCSALLPIYNACSSGDESHCLHLCQGSNLVGLVRSIISICVGQEDQSQAHLTLRSI